jgi:hypothetical protein
VGKDILLRYSVSAIADQPSGNPKKTKGSGIAATPTATTQIAAAAAAAVAAEQHATSAEYITL